MDASKLQREHDSILQRRKKKYYCFTITKFLYYFKRAWPINEMMKTAFKLMFWLSVLRDPVVVAFGIRISQTKKMKVHFFKMFMSFYVHAVRFPPAHGNENTRRNVKKKLCQ